MLNSDNYSSFADSFNYRSLFLIELVQKKKKEANDD